MVTKELLDYIKKQIAKGVSQEDIRKILLQYKWAEGDIGEAFNVINQANQPKVEKPKIEVKPLDEFRTQQQATKPAIVGETKPQVSQTQPQSQAAQAQSSVGQKSTPAQPVLQPQKPQAQSVQTKQAGGTQSPAQPQVQPQAQPQTQTQQPKSQVQVTIQKPVLESKPQTPYREPVTSSPQPQAQPALQPRSVGQARGVAPQFNFGPIIIGLVILVIVGLAGFFGYKAINDAKKREPTVKPEQPIVTTTQPQAETPKPQPSQNFSSPQSVSDESIVKELEAVIAYFKNKSAYSADEKADLEQSNELVNLSFFFQLYYSKNSKYPENIGDITSLGNYKMLKEYSVSMYNFAYGKTNTGEFRICAQYSKGYRCFLSDDVFRTRTKTYLKNLK